MNKTPLETLIHLRAKGAERANRFYENHKDDINFKRRVAYAIKHGNPIPQPQNGEQGDDFQPQDDEQPQQEEEVVQPKKKRYIFEENW